MSRGGFDPYDIILCKCPRDRYAVHIMSCTSIRHFMRVQHIRSRRASFVWQKWATVFGKEPPPSRVTAASRLPDFVGPYEILICVV